MSHIPLFETEFTDFITIRKSVYKFVIVVIDIVSYTPTVLVVFTYSCIFIQVIPLSFEPKKTFLLDIFD